MDAEHAPLLRRFTLRLNYNGEDVDFATFDDLEGALQLATQMAYTAGVSEVTIRDAETPSVLLVCERMDSNGGQKHGIGLPPA